MTAQLVAVAHKRVNDDCITMLIVTAFQRHVEDDQVARAQI